MALNIVQYNIHPLMCAFEKQALHTANGSVEPPRGRWGLFFVHSLAKVVPQKSWFPTKLKG